MANNAFLSFTKTDVRTLNPLVFEHLNKYRQYIQHHEILKISNSEDIFAKRFLTKPDGQKIFYRDDTSLGVIFGT